MGVSACPEMRNLAICFTCSKWHRCKHEVLRQRACYFGVVMVRALRKERRGGPKEGVSLIGGTAKVSPSSAVSKEWCLELTVTGEGKRG